VVPLDFPKTSPNLDEKERVMPYLVGVAVWAMAGVIAELLGGQFMSGKVFVFGGLAAAVVAGAVMAVQATRE
jgi:hypothetical protein